MELLAIKIGNSLILKNGEVVTADNLSDFLRCINKFHWTEVIDHNIKFRDTAFLIVEDIGQLILIGNISLSQLTGVNK